MNFLAPLSVSEDARRTITHLCRADIKDVNFYEAKRGAVLGEHHHKKTEEYFFITRGIALLQVDDERRVVHKGDFFVVKPNEKHSIECMSDFKFLTFLTEPFDKNDPDLHK